MSYKITDNIDLIKSQTTQRSSTFIRLVAENILDIAKPNTPKKLGNLSRDVLRRVQRLHGEIEWRKAYAQYQERVARADGSRRVKKYSTPGTGPHFAKNAVEKAVQNTIILARLAHLV